MIRFIQSAKNVNIKEVKSLLKKKGRESTGLFIVEGIRAVREAVISGASIDKIFITDDYYAIGLSESIESIMADKSIFVISDAIFDSISDTQSPQGILAVVKQNDLDFETFDDNGQFIVLLENVQDPGNLGTVIRTADACGVDLVILSDDCADIYNPKVVRSTMSSLFHVPVCKVKDMWACVQQLKRKGYTTYASCPENGISCFDVPFTGKTCLIFGNEANGLTKKIINCSDVPVKIPMPGKAESLNVSVAAGILMYEKVRKN